MPSRLHRCLIAGLALALALAPAGCGDSQSKVTTGTYAGESGASAPYLDVGPLVYQVQLSRELNPANTEDAGYLQGLTPSQRALRPGEEWFGVFLVVYNHATQAQPAASAITIADSQDNVFAPLPTASSNQFSYRAGLVPGDGQIPRPNTIAAAGPTQGALLLFRLPVASLDNRPLELRIVDPTNASQTASAELDV
jgi:hypothetical protein